MKFRKIIHELLLSAAALFASALICGIVILILGENPFEVYSLFLYGAFGTARGIMYTLFYATPLMLTGLAVGIGFRNGLLNIGAEGQMIAGAFAAAWVGFTFTELNSGLLILLAIVAAMTAGGVWGAIPGLLKAKFGAHEVINTIMMNYIAIGLTSYLVMNKYKSAGDMIPQTEEISSKAFFPWFSHFFDSLPSSVPLNPALFIGLLAAGLVYLLLWKTIPGFEIRASGFSERAAHSAGINTFTVTIIVMALSGALAGLAGINEVMGYRHRFLLGFSSGYGFTGIAVALMGRNHPAGIVASAILFGAIIRGGLMLDIYYSDISRDIIMIFQGVLILLITARMFKLKDFSHFSFSFFKQTKI